MNIFVGNLSGQATQQQLQELFAQYGMVDSVKILKDPYTGQSRGFGFVEMPEPSSALKAIESLNNSHHLGQFIEVNEARPRITGNGDSFRKDRN